MKGKMDGECWVDLRVIESFKKMRSMNAKVVDMATSLRGDSVLLQVSDDGMRVRRTRPLPGPVRAQVIPTAS